MGATWSEEEKGDEDTEAFGHKDIFGTRKELDDHIEAKKARFSQLTRSNSEIRRERYGIGVRFDMERLARGEAAIIVGVAVGGPAHRSNAVRPGDKIVYVDSSDISSLLKKAKAEREALGHLEPTDEDIADGASEELLLIQSVVLGQKGSIVRVGIVRPGVQTVIYKPLMRAGVDRDCEWEMMVDNNAGQDGDALSRGPSMDGLVA
mmetsp:Transcript_54487/g.129428  ORF Transcript_54487/g.129428 Transcript_54487/m.129428 type:complete len:206 (-) Transcript_54487:68-685(-)